MALAARLSATPTASHGNVRPCDSAADPLQLQDDRDISRYRDGILSLKISLASLRRRYNLKKRFTGTEKSSKNEDASMFLVDIVRFLKQLRGTEIFIDPLLRGLSLTTARVETSAQMTRRVRLLSGA